MTIGKTQDVRLGTKDAFHVQCILVTSGQGVCAGWYIRFVDKSLTKVVVSFKGEHHGTVDPFCSDVKAGEPFWMLLEPGLTSNLRHTFDLELEEPTDLSYSREVTPERVEKQLDDGGCGPDCE